MARPKKSDDAPTDTATVRVSKALLDQLDPFAKRANRSLSKEVEHRLRVSLEKAPSTKEGSSDQLKDQALIERFRTLLETLDIVAGSHWSHSTAGIEALRGGFASMLDETLPELSASRAKPDAAARQTGEVVGKIAASGLRDDLAQIAVQIGNKVYRRKE